jgi:quaternary ammonium compound-resistance protein SugE
LAWVFLLAAGLFETAWAVTLKASDGFSRLVPSILVVATGAASLFLLALALKELPVSVGYAVWTGIGTIGAAVTGMVLLDEPASAGRVLSIGVITMGIVLFALAE